jgi:hypothetical protein
MKKQLMIALIVLTIGTFFAIATWQTFTPLNLSKKEPRKMFEKFVCDPAPESITEIKASGIIAFAGGQAKIAFRINSVDMQTLIQRGRFKPIDDSAPEWVRNFTPQSGENITLRYMQNNRGTSESALFVADNGENCWYLESQY